MRCALFVFGLLVATAAPGQDPQLEFAGAVVDAARQGQAEVLQRLVRDQLPRAAFLVRDALRGAAKTGNLDLAELARQVANALEPGIVRRTLHAELEGWLARDAAAFAAARQFELHVDSAQAALAQGDGVAADAEVSKALTVAEALEDDYLTARARSLRGVAHKRAGKWDDAIADLAEAAEAERVLGAVLEREGDLGELADSHERRCERRNLLGDYEGSLADLLTAAEIWGELSRPDQEGRCQVIAGGAFAELARFADAEAALQRALEIFGEPSAPRGRAVAALGLCMLDQERLGEALPLLLQGRDLAREHGDGYGEAEACRLLARAYLETGQPDRAEQELARALELPATTLARALTWTARGDAAMARGSRDVAADYFRRALEEGVGLAEGSWRARVGLGVLAGPEARTAHDHFTAAVADLEHLRSLLRLPALRARALAERREPYLRAALLRARAGELAGAFALLEKLQARTLWEIRGAGGVEEEGGDLLRPLEIELAECERALAAAGESDRKALLERREGLRAQHERALLRLALAGPRSGVLGGRAPADLMAVAAALDDREALLCFGIGEQTGMCLIVRRGDTRFVELAVGRDEIDRHVDVLLEPMRALAAGNVDTGNLRFAVRAARVLHDLILAPLRLDAMGDVQRLWIVADGPLRRVPFALLVTSHEPRPVRPGVSYAQYHGCRYLVETFEVAILPAASLLTAPPPPGAARPGGALVVGHALPGAALEAEAVTAVLGVDVCPPSEDTIRSNASRAPILHLATHAEIDAARPAFSRLQLVGEGEVDGWLHAYEVAGMSLAAPLVVLSGCDTAGHAGAGEGLLGLTRAFLEAGARAVIATGWRVEDEASGALMADFHRRLAAGTDPVEALTLSQRGMLQRARTSGAAWSHPFFWAGYVLHGRP